MEKSAHPLLKNEQTVTATTIADSFEEEKRPDYAGLKIASMDITEKDEPPAQEEEEEVEQDQEDEDDKNNDAQEPVVPAEDKDPSMPNVSGGRYVPPSRSRASGGLFSRGARQVAPDLSTMVLDHAHRDRQTDSRKETDRQTDRKKETYRDRQTRHRDRQTDARDSQMRGFAISL